MDDGDADHRQRHNEEAAPCLLLAPLIEANDHVVTTAGLYRWEESQPDDAALVHAMDDGGYCSFRAWKEVAHDMAHCDGLVLLPGGEATTAARVLNPATGRVLTLPVGFRSGGHQAFGLGRDPSSGAYKVARFFYRSVDDDAGALGMEVLAIGTTAGQQQQHQWRETVAPPPYPVIPGRTATFFKGSLLWTPKDSYYGDAAPGFVRLSLDGDDDDEPFSFTPPPPCVPRVDYAASSLAVLRGELCFAQPGPDYDTSLFSSLELWVYSDDGGRCWERRYVVARLPPFRGYRSVRLVTAYGDVIVIQAGPRFLYRYNCRTGQQRAFAACTDFVCLDRLRYRHPDDDAAGGSGTTIVEYSTRSLSLRSHRLYEFDVIPYVPSLSAPV